MEKLSSGRVTSLASTEPWPMERSAGDVPIARLTSEGNEVTQQTNGHNHAIEAQVEIVKHNLRKRAREVTPILSI